MSRTIHDLSVWNKPLIDTCQYCSTSRANQALRSLANAGFQSRGLSTSVSFLPLPLPLFPFFGFRFISREVKTENSFPRSFFAPKPNWNACYAGHSEWRDCLSQLAQVPGLAEAKADVKRVTQNPGRFNFYDNSWHPKGLVLFFLLFSSNNRCMGLYGNLAQNRYTALHCDCGLFLRL